MHSLRRPPEFLDCYVCRRKVDVKNPYPQLCPDHMADLGASLREVEDLASDLNDRFTQAMTPAYDTRMLAVMVAAADLDLPGIHFVKTKRMTEFMRRLDATIAKDDDFAAIVATWWNARQASIDAEKLALQIAWTPISVEVRRNDYTH